MIRVFVVLFLFERSNRRGGGFLISGGGFFQTKHIDIVPGRSSRARPCVPGGVLELPPSDLNLVPSFFNCQRTRTQILTISLTIIPLFTHKAHMESLLGYSHVFSNVIVHYFPNRKSLRQPLNLTSPAAPLLKTACTPLSLRGQRHEIELFWISSSRLFQNQLLIHWFNNWFV